VGLLLVALLLLLLLLMLLVGLLVLVLVLLLLALPAALPLIGLQMVVMLLLRYHRLLLSLVWQQAGLHEAGGWMI